jgi:hypothetical protein
MTGSWTILWLSGRIRKFATSLDVRMSGAADELTRAPERVSLLQPGQHREALIKSRNLRQMDAPLTPFPLPTRFAFVCARATNV